MVKVVANVGGINWKMEMEIAEVGLVLLLFFLLLTSNLIPFFLPFLNSNDSDR
jgi:hypothetical protein